MKFKLTIHDNNGGLIGGVSCKTEKHLMSGIDSIKRSEEYRDTIIKETITQEEICKRINSLPPSVEKRIPKRYGDQLDIFEFAGKMKKDFTQRLWNYIL